MNKRAGTENVAAIVGLGRAAELARKELAEEAAHLKELRDYLYKGLTEKIEFVRRNGHPERCLPNTLNVSFKYLEGESIILSLDMEGVSVPTGSACTSGSLEPSHVLKAMGLPAHRTQNSIRFSLGAANTEEEIDRVVAILPGLVDKLRSLTRVPVRA